MSGLKVTAIVVEGGRDRAFEVDAHAAQVLLGLVRAGDSGCVVHEGSDLAGRIAACVYELCEGHGLSIRTERAEAMNGWQCLHVLETPVRIVHIERWGK